MSKVYKSSLFKKGQSGNPAGRPIGAYSPLRKQLMELRKLAINDVSEMYNNLREAAIIHKESWAYQIYFKELVSIPREWLSEIDISDIPKEIKNIGEVSSILAILVNKLLSVDSISVEEVHSLIKTLNSIKFTEQFGKQEENVFEKLSDTQIKQLLSWVEEAKKS